MEDNLAFELVPTVDRPPAFPGDVIGGKYRVERTLGAGGMSTVLAATHVDLGERFALKFLNRELLAEPTVVERFTQEARAACKIRNEHVARVYDVGTHEGVPFFVMEHLDGQDLAVVLAERHALGIAEAVDYVMQACEALAAAHRHGVIHRDIKPENLFLASDGALKAIKLLDFGISKASRAPALKGTGKLALGTPWYMSPEQIRDAASADERSDLWSLGVVLYELLVGHEPFRGETITELCARVLEEEPRRVEEERTDLPLELAAVIHRCLSKDPEARYQSAAELARALAPFAPARALVCAERAALLTGAWSTPREPMRSSGRRRIQKRASAVSGSRIGLLIAAIAVAVIVASARRSGEPSSELLPVETPRTMTFVRDPPVAPVVAAPQEEAPLPKPRPMPVIVPPRPRPPVATPPPSIEPPPPAPTTVELGY
jgi:eukaryotic-like serine/threonine-protein kinase